MASVKNIEFSNYCDSVYHELTGMKSKLLGFVDEIARMKGPERDMVNSHIAHFNDIVKTIDWKLEILTRSCPYEWSGYPGVERAGSVQVDEELSREPVAGYPGG